MFKITLEQTFRGSCKTWAKGSGIKHGLKAVIPCTLNHLGPFASTKYSLLQCFSLKHVTML